MIAAIVERAIVKQEQQLRTPMNYLRDIAAQSLSAFVKFGLFTPMAQHRAVATPEAHAVACLVAVQSEDCGPCGQIRVDQALAGGVDGALIDAALYNPAALPDPLGDVHRFATAVVTQAPEATDLGDRLEAKIGRKAMVDLALGIAGVRVYPTVKRALGYAKSCSLVEIKVA